MNKPTTLQELFAKPKSWTQGTFARDKYGHSSDIEDEASICFCASGGRRRVYGNTEDNSKAQAVVHKMQGYVFAQGYNSVPEWNDDPGRTIGDVRRMCRELNI